MNKFSKKYNHLLENSLPINAYCQNDLTLKTAIRNPIQLNEYIIIDVTHFTAVDFSKATLIGKVNSTLGMLDVYRATFTNQTIWYALVDPIIGPSASLCHIAFLFKEDLPLLRKNAYCLPEYRNKGLISELNLFIAKKEGITTISDTLMSQSGAKTWERMIRLYPSHCGIFYGPTQDVFAIDKIGTKQNGLTIVDPAKDSRSALYWFEDPDQGQKWFYIFLSFDEQPITEDEHIFYNAINRSLDSFQPYCFFGDGYE